MYRKVSANPMRGAAAVEFAIVLIPLIAIVFGIIECSFLFYDKAVITNASREGARCGVIFHPSPAIYHYAPVEKSSGVVSIKGTVEDYSSNYLIGFSTSPPVTAVDPPGGATTTLTGQHLTVTVTYTYNWLVLPRIVTAAWGPVTLSAVTKMMIE